MESEQFKMINAERLVLDDLYRDAIIKIFTLKKDLLIANNTLHEKNKELESVNNKLKELQAMFDELKSSSNSTIEL